MTENRYTVFQLSKVTGISEQNLRLLRKQSRVDYQKDYTAEQVKGFLGKRKLLPREKVGSRARKALQLYDELLALGYEARVK